MEKITLLFIGFLLSFQLFGQQDSLKNESLDLLDELALSSTEQVQLLPDRMIFTQRMLWGQRGVMRNFKRFELTPESREREMKLRRNMFIAHQTFGTITLWGMIAQGIVGTKLYNGNEDVEEVHEMLANGINISYSLTAAMALFSPPKMINEYKGYSSIKVHKMLAVVHMSSMIATNILVGMMHSDSKYKPYHRAAAFTAFGSFAASMIIVKF